MASLAQGEKTAISYDSARQRLRGCAAVSPPAAIFEPCQWDHGAEHNGANRHGIAEMPGQFGHEVEIHAPDAREQNRRNAGHRPDGHDLEQVVLLGADKTQIRVEQELELVGEMNLIIIE